MFIIYNKRTLPREDKTVWHLDELVWLKKNFYSMPASRLLAHINSLREDKITLTVFRNKCRELGLLKGPRPDFWLSREEKYLVNNYQKLGNVEICEALNKYMNRSRDFTVKQIWKKMKLLGLKRNQKQLIAIKRRHIDAGRYSNMQHVAAASRRYPQGKKVIRKNSDGRKYYWIKWQGRFVQYHRYVWQQNFGPIPSGHKIFFKDGNPMNCSPGNLFCSMKPHRYKKSIEATNDVFLKSDKVPGKRPYYPVVHFQPRQNIVNS